MLVYLLPYSRHQETGDIVVTCLFMLWTGFVLYCNSSLMVSDHSLNVAAGDSDGRRFANSLMHKKRQESGMRDNQAGFFHCTEISRYRYDNINLIRRCPLNITQFNWNTSLRLEYSRIIADPCWCMHITLVAPLNHWSDYFTDDVNHIPWPPWASFKTWSDWNPIIHT